MSANLLDTKYLNAPLAIGDEISITGKWVPKTKGGLFRKSPDSTDLLNEWQNIFDDARQDDGVLSTEVNHAVGEDAVLIHHVFKNADAVRAYFGTTAAAHSQDLLKVATPQLHMVRGLSVPVEVKTALEDKGVPVALGQYDYGFVRDYAAPDQSSAIQVTAKWACKPSSSEDSFQELRHWWQQVGDEAHDIESGMLRFEVFDIPGENALIIHETFDSTAELKFHLTKGTAAKYKKQIDKIAAPDAYYFRGPVEWMIRTYSKFMHLPATYSSLGSYHTQPQGSHSAGLITA